MIPCPARKMHAVGQSLGERSTIPCLLASVRQGNGPACGMADWFQTCMLTLKPALGPFAFTVRCAYIHGFGLAQEHILKLV